MEFGKDPAGQTGNPLQRFRHEALCYGIIPLAGTAADCFCYTRADLQPLLLLLSLIHWTLWAVFWFSFDLGCVKKPVLRACCKVAALLPVGLLVLFQCETMLHLLFRQTVTADIAAILAEHRDKALFKGVPLLVLLIALFSYLESERPEPAPLFRRFLLPAGGAAFLLWLLLLPATFAGGTIRNALEYRGIQAQYAERHGTANRDRLPPAIRRDDAAGVFFLVIGESQSAVPYRELAEKKTLFLSELLHSPDWICHTEIRTHCPAAGERRYPGQAPTDYIVGSILTGTGPDSGPQEFCTVPNLFEYAAAGRYETVFCTTQAAWRGFLTDLRMIGDTADRTVWLTDPEPARNRHMSIDRNAVALLRKWREAGSLSGRKLVILKLMGNHEGNIAPPPELAAANPGVDEYGLSLLYFDETLRLLAAEARKCPDYAAFLYLPDHGRHYRSDEELILLIHLADRFRQAHPELEPELRRSIKKPVTGTKLFPVLLGLLGITPVGE